jgi:putative hydrolase
MENTRRYKLDLHTHTIASGHAYSTIDENARYAASIGVELLGISDHAPAMPHSTGELYFLNLRVVPRNLHGVRLLMGAELNIMDVNGKVDLRKGLLKRLDYTIASLHIPCIKPMGIEESTQTTIAAIKNPYINIIGHPCDPRYAIDIKAVVTAARDNGTLLEINNSSLNPGSSRAGGEADIVELLRECKRQAMPVILGSDAHFYSYIGGFDNIIPLLEEANMPDELIVNANEQLFFDFLAIKKKAQTEEQ